MMVRRVILVTATLLLAGWAYCAHAQNSSQARIEAFAKLPDWSGLWEFDIWVDELDGQEMGPRGMQRARIYAGEMQATFTPAWQAKLDQLKKTVKADEATDANNPPAFEEFGRLGGCGWTPGFPATMLPGTYEWRVTPEETTLISLLGSVRHIYTDGRPHPPKDELWPMSEGDSIGHWEGDTLVVETTNFTDRTAFQDSGEHMKLTERFMRTGPNTLLYEFTVDDPESFTRPWTARYPLTKTNDLIYEYACHEGNYGLEGSLAGARAQEKAAASSPTNKSK
jgi:hypothetical protein